MRNELRESNRDGNTSYLFKELHKYFACEFYLIGLLKFISDCLTFGGPILLNAIVSFIENERKGVECFYYVLGLFLVVFFSALSSTHYNYLITKISFKIKACLIMAVYQKTLFISKMTLNNVSSGEILNYISTDTDRIVNFCQSFHQFWSLPVQVVIALIFLYSQVSFCFFVGFGLMLVVVPLNQLIAKKIASYSNLMMKAKDMRIKIMNEILSGIRIIKVNTWEALFYNKVNATRHEEMKYLKKRKYLDALCVYFWATTPVIMSYLTFTLFSALGYELTAARVFTSIALFHMLIMPLNAFPWVLNGLMEAWISLKRVNSFLQLPNFDYHCYYSMPISRYFCLFITNYLKISNVFIYDAGEELSKQPFYCGPINLRLMQGSYICIIGKVGSGKSSFLSSILGDMNCISGSVAFHDSERMNGIGYVSQEPWIQQKSVKDNILFGKNMNTMRYRKVLEVCALLDDLETFPYGDNTIVGDKGTTLSGGQKARIALARAVYQDFEIYLLDDPFSAVDAHVAEHIFSNCIMGLLKNKTRILCTHKNKFAENADHLVVFSGGKVSMQGPPQQIMQLHFMDLNDDSTEEATNVLSKAVEKTTEDKEHIIVEEEKKEGVVEFHVIHSYWKAVGSILSISVLIFCFLMQASRTLCDWWLSFWVSNTSTHNWNSSLSSHYWLTSEANQSHSLRFYLGVYGGLAASNSVFTLFRAFLFAVAGLGAAVSLHDKLLKTILNATMCFFDTTPLGRIINRFSSDIYCVDDTLPFQLNILLAQVFSLIGSLVITCYGLPWILILFSILTVIYFKIQKYYRHTSRELKRLSSISLSPIYAHFSETLNGHSTIRAMSGTARFQRENMVCVDSNIRAVLSTAAASQWLNLRLQFIGVIIVTGVALIAMWQNQLGGVDAGLVGLALSYALSITSLLNGTVTAFTETEKEIVSVERVMQFIEEIDTESDDYCQMPPFAWPSHGVITFTSVSLKYRPDCPYALKNVSFETRPCEKIGIVGRTGSGKSSLIQVLCRMVNFFEGAVFIDGVNISNLELKKLRSKLSIIPQDPFLFSGSVRENLDPNFLRSDAEIWKALRFCHMEEKIHSVGGLGSEMKEKGENFSIGERQLFCLTRSLLQRAKILCMDEATASIDYQTDSLIRQTVRMAFRHSTVLIIAHRVESVMDCDRVLVMKEGEILEIGQPSDLLSNPKSAFYSLVYRTNN
ncbi:ATP-binding cassette sub-family C member 10-like [Uloborus diversus]|uniref:ATP-binding cassette sub-family C member 10-like n=1 Tax=Uloborus diversus TaxID=327109 RepID=UPI002409AE51|nr:ATP-binding cassette sub-family C member 10-like [Uloborus diversus]